MMNRMQNINKYRMINKTVVAYVVAVLIFQVLFLISPIMTFFAKTPLYSIQTYLGVLGGILLSIDMFTSKVMWKGPYCIFLYIICILAGIASIRMISYGVKENLFKLCWAIIQMTLMYSCAYRMKEEQFKRGVWHVYIFIALIWFFACCISLYQYAIQVGYMVRVNPLAIDSSMTRQGFYDNRLFGIFYTLNHAAYVSLFLFLAGMVYIKSSKKILVKMTLIINEVVLLFHIILCNSRSAMLAMIVCLFFVFCFLSRNKVILNNKRGKIISILSSALLILFCLISFHGIKLGLTYIPKFCDYMKTPKMIYSLDNKSSYIRNQNINLSVQNIRNITQDEKIDENILQRKDLEDDSSNGRLSIWKDYLSLYKEVGIIGISPGNYMGYIMKNHPELYIVDYIKREYPDKYKSGIIYHVHSGYVMVYVSAGILGMFFLSIFMILCLKQMIKKLKRKYRMKDLFIISFIVVVGGAISIIFDEGIFFQNNPHSTIFWIALGVLMRECTDRKENVCL